MAIPYRVIVNTFVAGGGTSGSNSLTFSFVNTGFDANVLIQITSPGTTSISAGAEVYLYRSTDNGLTYENVASIATAFPKPTVASQVQREVVNIPFGTWLVQVMVGGGTSSTWTAQILTAEVLTAMA